MAASQLTAQQQKWPAAKVRETYIDFFTKQNGHTFWPSSKTVPYDDPTLLFTNSGMVQYKPIFLGIADQNTDFGRLKRAVNSQKCIRAGGKHNDLDDVGKDETHLTFFEMLGNWSFGDYFKREAIQMAWKLLTEVYGLDPERLYVSYFQGDEKQGLAPDLEAKQIWIDTGVPESRIVPGNAKDNFWEMGPTGPCGPCSEIHYDHVGGRAAADLVNVDGSQVIEIWNLVFMQYNREADLSLKNLPNKHIDTGLGFERLVSVLQGVSSNYDTDVFTPLFARIQELTKARPYAGKFGSEDTDGIDTAYRVVADHVRTLVFALADGGVPSNIGRGYVLRRILRRGSRFIRKKFGVPIGSFFSSLMPALVDQLGSFFPELTTKVETIKLLLDEEEESFARTLDRGEKLFDSYAATAKANNQTELNGKDVWKLYDTFGFPVDLTEIMAEEQGLKINQKEFEAAQAASKEASKGLAKKSDTEIVKLDVHDIAQLEKNADVPKTNDDAKYGRENISAQVKAIYDSRAFHSSTSDIAPGKSFGIILDKTCFYAESGGQEGDTGIITIDGKVEFEVEDVQVFNGYVMHVGTLKEGQLSLNNQVTCTYDELRRWPIRNNHTGTHILNFALREVLGDHIDQRGSLVAPTKLRFDFSHKGPVTVPELEKIEAICNDWIKKNVAVYSKELPLKLAHDIPGLRAVFGEAYPDPVRVVTLEFSVDEIAADIANPKWRQTSVEFCGGTHVETTGDIKDFVITEEAGIAKGVRRIIAVTATEAREASHLANEAEDELNHIKTLKGKEREKAAKSYLTSLDAKDISQIRRAKLKEQHTKLTKELVEEAKVLERAESKKAVDAVTDFFTANPNARVCVLEVDVGSMTKALQAALQHVTKQYQRAAYLFSVDKAEGKVVHVNLLPKGEVSKTFNCKEWIGAVSKIVGGRGGGKDEGAQAIGTDVTKVQEAIQEAKAYYEKGQGSL